MAANPGLANGKQRPDPGHRRHGRGVQSLKALSSRRFRGGAGLRLQPSGRMSQPDTRMQEIPFPIGIAAGDARILKLRSPQLKMPAGLRHRSRHRCLAGRQDGRGLDHEMPVDAGARPSDRRTAGGIQSTARRPIQSGARRRRPSGGGRTNSDQPTRAFHVPWHDTFGFCDLLGTIPEQQYIASRNGRGTGLGSLGRQVVETERALRRRNGALVADLIRFGRR